MFYKDPAFFSFYFCVNLTIGKIIIQLTMSLLYDETFYLSLLLLVLLNLKTVFDLEKLGLFLLHNDPKWDFVNYVIKVKDSVY